MTSEIFPELEQAEAHLRDFAVLAASYYQDMVDAGMPVDLAYELTIDFCHLWFCNVLGSKDEEKQ